MDERLQKDGKKGGILDKGCSLNQNLYLETIDGHLSLSELLPPQKIAKGQQKGALAGYNRLESWTRNKKLVNISKGLRAESQSEFIHIWSQ